jgi:hypothetical protein
MTSWLHPQGILRLRGSEATLKYASGWMNQPLFVTPEDTS